MAVIPVDIAGRPYEVRVGTGLLAALVEQCSGRLRKRRVPIVTDAQVHAAWGPVVENALHQGGHEAAWRILPPGEASKSWEQLAATGTPRDDLQRLEDAVGAGLDAVIETVSTLAEPRPEDLFANIWTPAQGKATA